MLTACIITQACASTTAELEEQVSACQQIKDKSHEMAECARFLGFDEDHIIIQTAKAKWMEAHTEELNLQQQIEEMESAVFVWDGPILTRSKGVNYGPTGKETYYNLPMGGVIRIMRNLGYSETEWPHWIRDDGVHMLGNYVMLAGRIGQFKRGTIVPCSLGRGIICDYGYLEWNAVDVAVIW